MKTEKERERQRERQRERERDRERLAGGWGVDELYFNLEFYQNYRILLLIDTEHTIHKLFL